MLAFALIPLGLYFGFLAVMTAYSRPSVFSGRQDFMILSCGLFGLLTCGPGKLLIPLPILTYWGPQAWLFWIMFYFLTAYWAACRVTRHIVIYHAPVPELLPGLLELGKRLDPTARLEGNVFFLPTLGVQCALEGGALGGHLLLSATGPHQSRNGWTLFENELVALCGGLRIPRGRPCLLWGFLSLLTLAGAGIFLVSNITDIVNVCMDYWG